jgi:hypothetical protein
MKRNITDALLTATVALPAAGAAASTPAIDLVTGGGVEACEVEISHPALANLANTISATLTIQHSDEAAANFVAIPGLATLVTTGGASGADAASRQVRFPSDCKRYVRLNAAVAANGGDNTDANVTIALKL